MHKVIVPKDGTGWRAMCTCGWDGRKHYSTGARSAASADKLQHLEVIAERETGTSGNAERMWGKTHAMPV